MKERRCRGVHQVDVEQVNFQFFPVQRKGKRRGRRGGGGEGKDDTIYNT